MKRPDRNDEKYQYKYSWSEDSPVRTIFKFQEWDADNAQHITQIQERVNELEGSKKEMLLDLFEHIKHGDKERQKWLKNKINEFIDK